MASASGGVKEGFWVGIGVALALAVWGFVNAFITRTVSSHGG